METSLFILVAYFAAWLAGGTFCMLRCKMDEDSRIVFTPLSLILRLTRSLGFLDRVQGSRVARILGIIGIALLFFSLYQYYQVTVSSIVTRFFSPLGKNIPPPFAPLVPGLTVSLDTFLLLLPGLSIAMIIHELAHAVAAKAERLPIKSAGIVVFLAYIFGAFVEIDEDKLKRAPLLSRLSVYSAGVAANLLAALIILYGVLFPLMNTPTGLLIVDVVEGSPAARAGLEKYDVIIAVNDTPVHNFQDLSKILSEGAKKAENQIYAIKIIRDHRNLTVLVKRNNSNKIGVLIGPIPLFLVNSIGSRNAYYLYQSLFYTFMLNYVLAVINAAPLFITDGARVLDALLTRISERRGLAFSRALQVLTLLLLLANLNLGTIG